MVDGAGGAEVDGTVDGAGGTEVNGTVDGAGRAEETVTGGRCRERSSRHLEFQLSREQVLVNLP